ncbi:hypothetical protein HZD82_27770, partial [Pantoea agglomerans]|uniref:hypothetical protein n=1 Tax=Enterobacter agglomerans TaxID=549 RepID=UPI001A8C2635
LIQNLMYDVSQLALPWDKVDREFLNKPRKWDAGNIKRFMLTLFICLQAHASLFSNPATSRFVPVDQAFTFDFDQKGSQL